MVALGLAELTWLSWISFPRISIYQRRALPPAHLAFCFPPLHDCQTLHTPVLIRPSVGDNTNNDTGFATNLIFYGNTTLPWSDHRFLHYCTAVTFQWKPSRQPPNPVIGTRLETLLRQLAKYRTVRRTHLPWYFDSASIDNKNTTRDFLISFEKCFS